LHLKFGDWVSVVLDFAIEGGQTGHLEDFLPRVRNIFGGWGEACAPFQPPSSALACGLNILFFDTSVSFRFTDGTWVLGKDWLGTSVYFSV